MAKLLLVIDSLGSGGAQRQLITLSKEFKSRGHTVEFFIYYPQLSHFEDELLQAGIHIHKYNKRHRLDLGIPFSLAKVISKNKYDATLAFLPTPALYLETAILLLFITLRHRPRVVFSERSSYFEDKPIRFSFRLIQQFHRICDHIVVNSHHQSEKMMKQFPWMRDKISTIYNGIDLAAFTRTHEYESESTDSYILCVARVVDYKNYEQLANAMIYYKEQWGNPPKVLWIGKIEQEMHNKALLDRVISRIQDAELEDKFVFVGEILDVQSYYENAMALIHPSFIEGFSNSIIEGMSYGLPQLIGDVCDHKKLISAFNNGILFDPYNHLSIAKAVNQFINSSKEERLDWSNNSLKATHQAFSKETAATMYLSLMVPENK